MKKKLVQFWNLKLKTCDVCAKEFKPLNGHQYRCSKECIKQHRKKIYGYEYYKDRNFKIRQTEEYKQYHREYRNKWAKTPYGLLYGRVHKYKSHGNENLKKYLIDLLLTTKECSLCNIQLGIGAQAPHIDHIIPLGLGGLHKKDNIRILCRTCNLRRPKDGRDYIQI